ncbi:MAG: EAL domain-containing protein [Sporolactobacillus sp.]
MRRTAIGEKDNEALDGLYFTEVEMSPLDIYVARQPIYDRRMTVFGYELLYRSGSKNYFEGIDDATATATLLNNSILVMNFDELTDGTRGFINFSEGFLKAEFPKLISPNKIVIEILERVQITEQVIEACKALKKSGYTLALDDFTFDPSIIKSGLLQYIDIIKIEFSLTNLKQQLTLMKQCDPHIQFLAEKVETQNEYAIARRMGYELFQGYYFSRPIIMNDHDIPSLNHIMLQIISELKNPETDYERLTEMFQADVGLAYKVIRLANTVNYGTKTTIGSVRQALTRVGLIDLEKWMSLLMLQDLKVKTNEEVIKNSLIRAKMMESLAACLPAPISANEYFMTGLFSQLDVILNKDMRDVIYSLPITEAIKRALTGEKNRMNDVLMLVAALQEADWQTAMPLLKTYEISVQTCMAKYLDALKWVRTIA